MNAGTSSGWSRRRAASDETLRGGAGGRDRDRSKRAAYPVRPLIPGRMVVIGGTGTSIGKTQFAEAVLYAWRKTARVVGLKPVESGVVDRSRSDAARLAAASSFHVKQGGYALAAPLSPHLAARDEGVEIRTELVVQLARDAREQADGVLLELAGGLFTPVTDRICNADLAAILAPDALLLVAPDRLGVLHVVAATTRSASTLPLRIDGIVLMAPECPASSPGGNANELPRVTGVPVIAALPRAASLELAHLPAVQRIVDAIASGQKLGGV